MGRQEGPASAGRAPGRGHAAATSGGRGGGGRGGRGRNSSYRRSGSGGRGRGRGDGASNGSTAASSGNNNVGVGAPLREAAERAKSQASRFTPPVADAAAHCHQPKPKSKPKPKPNKPKAAKRSNDVGRISQAAENGRRTRERMESASGVPIATVDATMTVPVEELIAIKEGFVDLAQRLVDIENSVNASTSSSANKASRSNRAACGKCNNMASALQEIRQHVSNAQLALSGVQDKLDSVLLGSSSSSDGTTTDDVPAVETRTTCRTPAQNVEEEKKRDSPPPQPKPMPRSSASRSSSKAKPCTSLEDLVSLACAEYIVGLQSDFLAFLRSEDIETCDDLAMAVVECLDMIAQGGDESGGDNPLTGIVFGKEELFRDAVLAAVSNGGGMGNAQRSSSEHFRDGIDSEDEVLSAHNGALDIAGSGNLASGTSDTWSCPACTFANPNIYLACSMCGTELPAKGDGASNAAVCPDSEAELLLHQGLERQRQEEEKIRRAAEMARKEEEEKLRRREEAQRQRERAKKAKQDEVRRLAQQKEEEEKAAAEVDRLRRLEAKLEKEAAMARYNAEQQQQQPTPSASTPGRTASAKPKGPASKNLDASPARSISSSSVATADRSLRSDASQSARNTSASSSVRRNKNTRLLYGNRLAPFIARNQVLHGETTDISRIFALLQDESSVDSGRQLILLEYGAKHCNEELSDLVRQKANLEIGMASEEKILADKEKKIRMLERDVLKRFSHRVSGFVSWTTEKMKDVLDGLDKEEEEEEAAASTTAEEKAKISIREREAKKKEAQKKKAKQSQRYTEVKETKEEIEREQKQIKLVKESIEALKEKVQSLDEPISSKKAELEGLRSEIGEIKGEGEKEDASFNLDGNRTQEGNSFLHIAAMNDDFETARICLSLGANPNVINSGGHTPVSYAAYFGFDEIVELISRNGGQMPASASEIWSGLRSVHRMSKESSRNWDLTLEVAQSAAVPAEQLIESPEECEKSKERRMPILSTQERQSMDFICFEARLQNTNINSDVMRRVVLLDKAVYEWCITSTRETLEIFVCVLEGLKPGHVRRQGVKPTQCHRRAIIGNVKTFELLAAPFLDNTKKQQVALFTPFVSGEIHGVSSVGVLVWAVAPDNEASLYKTLIANAEFMRHKTILEDRFAPHKEGVLELGRDMHLLDLHSTSIWTTSAMEMFILDIDSGDLDRIQNEKNFAAKKRIVYSQEIINQAIFRTSAEESKENEEMLLGERHDMSTHLSGGAGTGKTLLMIKKVCSEDASRRILVLSRLPRLVSIMKAKVETERDVSNVTFLTYDDLIVLLARRVAPENDNEYKNFSTFNRVRFDCGVEGGISFVNDFIDGYLNNNERTRLVNHQVEPLTLWAGVITIKSNAKCVLTKAPLSREDYLCLGPSYGLRKDQREVVYDFYLQYQEWLSTSDVQAWDESDRSMYVMTHGPSVFSDENFIPWKQRVESFGEMDLLDSNGNPLHPFFFDMVFVDEAQDFTEMDMALFLRQSAGLKSLFAGADPAQSVEQGIKMRAGTINDVFHSSKSNDRLQVKDVLQVLSLSTNHRTHSQNLALGKAIRRILARSFGVPNSDESAIVEGRQPPRTLRIKKVADLIDNSIFVAPNVVFLAPDEKIHELRALFRDLQINNDLFGVREAKGLEFDSVALLGFFDYIEELGSSKEWKNVLRWLSSESNLRKTESDEVFAGVRLEQCDYRLSHPEVSSQAMMLYTAITRARNVLYLIEVGNTKSKGGSLSDFAFRRLKGLKLAESVSRINEGQVEMTPAEHKARGVLLVTRAIDMVRNHENIGLVRERFLEAIERFEPTKGNDAELRDQAQRHLDAVLEKYTLTSQIKERFYSGGEYVLEGRFADVVEFEKKAARFFASFCGDPFLVDDVQEMRSLIEEVFLGSPYETRFADICQTIRRLESFV